jgi:hypothetical protein
MLGINECIELYDAALRCHNDRHEMQQRRQLKLVLGRVQRLRRLMNDDTIWADDFWKSKSWRAAPPQTPRAAIEALKVLINQEIFERTYDYEDTEDSYRHSFQARSPFEALFGDWLPLLYSELGFPTGDLTSKNGPFIRFARAVADELKIKKNGRRYAAESFIKAVRNVAAGNVRRSLPRPLPDLEYYAEFHRDGIRAVLKSLEATAVTPAGQIAIKK